MKTKWICSVLAVMALGAVASAKDKDEIRQVVRAETPEQFDVMAASVRKDMPPRGRYQYGSPKEKADVDAGLDQMAAMLKKNGSVSAMNDVERLALFNVQEKVNGTLTHTDSERLVCEKVAPVGTHIPITICKTYAQIARTRQDTQRFLEGKETNVHQKAAELKPGTAASIQGGAR